MPRISPIVTVLAIVLWTMGCGGDGKGLVPVQGKLTVKGAPLDNTLVRFFPPPDLPGNPGASGFSDAKGSFTVEGSRLGAKGALPGEYRVSLSRTVDAGGAVLAQFHESQPGHYESIPAPYSDPGQSPLKAKVPPKGGPVEIDMPVDLVRKKP